MSRRHLRARGRRPEDRSDRRETWTTVVLAVLTTVGFLAAGAMALFIGFIWYVDTYGWEH